MPILEIHCTVKTEKLAQWRTPVKNPYSSLTWYYVRIFIIFSEPVTLYSIDLTSEEEALRVNIKFQESETKIN